MTILLVLCYDRPPKTLFIHIGPSSESSQALQGQSAQCDGKEEPGMGPDLSGYFSK